MHNLPKSLAAIAAAVALNVPAPALACTAFQLESNDGAQIYFRSMEFGYPFNSKMLIVPRGTEFTSTAPGGKPGKKWTAKYGFVGLNVDIAPNVVADGQNEKGLAIGMLYLPGFAQYQEPAAAPADQSIGSWEVLNYLLANCSSVDEAVGALQDDVYVAQQEFVP
ncbi:MAG: linear amide C-N hydrolase, partial [Chthoniobacterales bacterium]